MPKMSYILSAWQIQFEVMLKSDSNKGFILISDMRHFTLTQSAVLMTDFMNLLDLLKVGIEISGKHNNSHWYAKGANLVEKFRIRSKRRPELFLRKNL